MKLKEEYIDFIGVYEKALPLELCNQIIEAHQQLEENGGSWVGSTGAGVKKSIKNTIDVDISVHPRYNMLVEEANKYLQLAYQKYEEQYWVIEQLQPHVLSAYQVQKYKKEEQSAYFNFHCEASNFSNSRRCMTYIVYLNDIEEGGETEFLYQKLRITPEAGTIVYFPAYFTHTHRGNPVLSNQDKYIMTGWLEFNGG